MNEFQQFSLTTHDVLVPHFNTYWIASLRWNINSESIIYIMAGVEINGCLVLACSMYINEGLNVNLSES